MFEIENFVSSSNIRDFFRKGKWHYGCTVTQIMNEARGETLLHLFRFPADSDFENNRIHMMRDQVNKVDDPNRDFVFVLKRIERQCELGQDIALEKDS